MNKYKESLDNIKIIITSWERAYYAANKRTFSLKSLIDLNINNLQELVEKATPKKPLGLSITYDGRVGNCPKCKKFIRYIENTVGCSYCLQKLDWNKDEE